MLIRSHDLLYHVTETMWFNGSRTPEVDTVEGRIKPSLKYELYSSSLATVSMFYSVIIHLHTMFTFYTLNLSYLILYYHILSYNALHL